MEGVFFKILMQAMLLDIAGDEAKRIKNQLSKFGTEADVKVEITYKSFDKEKFEKAKAEEEKANDIFKKLMGDLPGDSE